MSISCDMLVFGGTGDLTLHKLLPALYHLHRDGRLHADVHELQPSSTLLRQLGHGLAQHAKVRWQQSSGYSHPNMRQDPFTPETVRENWSVGGDFSNPHYPNFSFEIGGKIPNAGHTHNLLNQGIMVLPKKAKL